MADDLEGDAPAGGREDDAAVLHVLEQAERRQPLEHPGGRRWTDAEPLRDDGRRRAASGLGQLVDLAQVVLHCIGDRLRPARCLRLAHEATKSPVTYMTRMPAR